MKSKELIWVGGFSSIFFFLPSLALKIGEYFINAPWSVKRMTGYSLVAVALIGFIRRRLRWRKLKQAFFSKDAPLIIAQRRLAQGEISLDEFRQIKEELQ